MTLLHLFRELLPISPSSQLNSRRDKSLASSLQQHCAIGGLIAAAALLSSSGCKPKRAAPQADAGLPAVHAISAERLEAVNNAKHQPEYRGPTGVVEGTITMGGDEAPDVTAQMDKIPANCSGALSMYGKAFREGPGRVVADVLVAVTDYQGHVKPKTDSVNVSGSGCSWDRRTISMTFGQRLAVRSVDSLPYVPQLLGSPTGALLVAVPNGEAVPVLPLEPGHYELVDAMRLFSRADVYVVRYPTTDVTGVDGHYRIEGVPVGKATVSALLPATKSTASKAVVIEAGQSARVDLVLNFNKADFHPEDKTAGATPNQQ